MNGHDPTSDIHGERDDPEVAAALERHGDTLRSAAVWESPPADLAERIISHVATLRVGDGHTGGINQPEAVEPSASIDVARRRRASRWWPALAAAAAVVLAFAGGLWLVGDDDGRRSLEPIADVELAATELATGASASGTVMDAGAGYSITINVAGLPPAPDGEYYEGWLHEEASGDWVSVGTFHMRGGDGRVVLWSGVPIDRYRQLVVTTEVEGATSGHGDILLSGVLEHR
jgi:hypothetical protein